jgi:hypothetical protein
VTYTDGLTREARNTSRTTSDSSTCPAFDAKAPPPKTAAFYEIVDASRAPEDAELADALDALGWPDAVTLAQVANHATVDDFAEWLRERKNSRKIPHRMGDCGYVAVRNPDAPTDGLWKLGARRQVIYAKNELTERERMACASKLAGTR